RDVVLSARRTRGSADDRNVRRRVPPLHGADLAHLAGHLLGTGRRCAAMHVSDRGSTRPFHVRALTVVSCHAAGAARMPASGVNLGPRGFGGVGELVDLMRMRDGLARGFCTGSSLSAGSRRRLVMCNQSNGAALGNNPMKSYDHELSKAT